ncbi:MAG: hypothetical protein PVJ09_03130 [Candidatus Woesebacteria bacterium]|jgi:hypothetical protein
MPGNGPEKIRPDLADIQYKFGLTDQSLLKIIAERLQRGKSKEIIEAELIKDGIDPESLGAAIARARMDPRKR